MASYKRADELKAGDKIVATDTGEVLTVKSIGHGLIRGHISIIHKDGFSEVARNCMVELAK
jgi:hypothetical protein